MSQQPSKQLHLAVALDGTGWHPASWREPDAQPTALLSAGYWADLVGEAERGLLDFVTIEDSLAQQSTGHAGPDARLDQVRGRLDAMLIAARIVPLTSNIGLIPTVVVTHTEPFHVSKAIATLDFVSGGRAGLRIKVSARPDEAAHFARRSVPEFQLDGSRIPGDAEVLIDLFDEAADYVEVLRRLWDSWEDDAEIRDTATGRFIDRDRLRYIDFVGKHFRVRGPSITPRPPQGQPIVSALAHQAVPYRLLGRVADVGFVTPIDVRDGTDIVATIRAEQDAADRADSPLRMFGDLVVFLDDDASRAADRKARLDELDGAEYASDAYIFVGTPDQLAVLLLDWRRAGLSGFRLRPGTIPHDLEQITRVLVPRLQQLPAFRTRHQADTLRGLLGLTRPTNCYTAA